MADSEKKQASPKSVRHLVSTSLARTHQVLTSRHLRKVYSHARKVEVEEGGNRVLGKMKAMVEGTAHALHEKKEAHMRIQSVAVNVTTQHHVRKQVIEEMEHGLTADLDNYIESHAAERRQSVNDILTKIMGKLVSLNVGMADVEAVIKHAVFDRRDTVLVLNGIEEDLLLHLSNLNNLSAELRAMDHKKLVAQAYEILLDLQILRGHMDVTQIPDNFVFAKEEGRKLQLPEMPTTVKPMTKADTTRRRAILKRSMSMVKSTLSLADSTRFLPPPDWYPQDVPEQPAGFVLPVPQASSRASLDLSQQSLLAESVQRLPQAAEEVLQERGHAETDAAPEVPMDRHDVPRKPAEPAPSKQREFPFPRRCLLIQDAEAVDQIRQQFGTKEEEQKSDDFEPEERTGEVATEYSFVTALQRSGDGAQMILEGSSRAPVPRRKKTKPSGPPILVKHLRTRPVHPQKEVLHSALEAFPAIADSLALPQSERQHPSTQRRERQPSPNSKQPERYGDVQSHLSEQRRERLPSPNSKEPEWYEGAYTVDRMNFHERGAASGRQRSTERRQSPGREPALQRHSLRETWPAPERQAGQHWPTSARQQSSRDRRPSPERQAGQHWPTSARQSSTERRRLLPERQTSPNRRRSPDSHSPERVWHERTEYRTIDGLRETFPEWPFRASASLQSLKLPTPEPPEVMWKSASMKLFPSADILGKDVTQPLENLGVLHTDFMTNLASPRRAARPINAPLHDVMKHPLLRDSSMQSLQSWSDL